MSTEINLDELYNNSVKILTDLIGFRTISGEDNSALIDYCEDYLLKLGATSFKTFDAEKKRINLFATLKAKKTNGIKPIILSGHTDTVPVSKSWSTDPFKATIKGDKLYGRGSCDMKGIIAWTLAFAPVYANTNLFTLIEKVEKCEFGSFVNKVNKNWVHAIIHKTKSKNPNKIM